MSASGPHSPLVVISIALLISSRSNFVGLTLPKVRTKTHMTKGPLVPEKTNFTLN